MTDPAQAFLNHGNVDQWTRGAGPITGQRARFAARGVRNVDDGWNLLRDIFLFATLECVAAARYPAP